MHLILYLVLQPGHQVSLILQNFWGRLLVHKGLQTPRPYVKLSCSGVSVFARSWEILLYCVMEGNMHLLLRCWGTGAMQNIHLPFSS